MIEKENFEVNLNNDEGAKIVKLSVNAILNKEENPILEDDVLSLPARKYDPESQVQAVKSEGFNFSGILELCQKVKLGS